MHSPFSKLSSGVSNSLFAAIAKAPRSGSIRRCDQLQQRLMQQIIDQLLLKAKKQIDRLVDAVYVLKNKKTQANVQSVLKDPVDDQIQALTSALSFACSSL